MDDSRVVARRGLVILTSLVSMLGIVDMVARNSVNIVVVIVCIGAIILVLPLWNPKVDKQD